MLWRGSLLVLLCVMAVVSGRAQEASGQDISEVALDLRAYQAELDRCAESIRHGDDLPGLRNSLPRHWAVQTEQSPIVVPTDWLASDLLRAEHDSKQSKAILRGAQRRLAAMRQAADELEGGSKAVDEGSARNHLNKILQRREFAKANGPSQTELWGARINRWIAEQIMRLLSLFHVGRTAGNVVTWGIVALAFSILCYWAWQNLFRAAHTAGAAPQRAEAATDSRQWAKDALAAAERGDYREAVHCAYWATVVHLESLGVLKRDHARTPRESLRLLEPFPKERQLLGDFTRHFELIWYGYRVASLQDWMNARTHLEKMGCLTPSTPATANS